MSFIIRRAVPKDASIVWRIVTDTLVAYGITPSPDGLDRDLKFFGSPIAANAADFVAETNGIVIGSVCISPKLSDAGVGEMHKLFVDATFRGQGVGLALHNEAVRFAKAAGYASLWLQTRTRFAAAVRLYEANGWLRGADQPQDHNKPDRTYILLL
jgi:GNAT superfamily N-acetyltransferase